MPESITPSTPQSASQGINGVPSRSTSNTPIRSGPRIVESRPTNDNRPRYTGDNPNITRASRLRQNVEDLNIEDEYFEGGENNGGDTPSIKYRIGAVMSLVLGLIASMLDLTEFALDFGGTLFAGVGVVFGYIKDAITIVVIPFIFWILGAPFWKGRKVKKKIITMVTAFLISLAPWIGGVMPETLVSTAVTIYLTRKEDKEKFIEKNNNIVKDFNMIRSRRTN